MATSSNRAAGRGGNITALGKQTVFDGTIEFTDNLVILGRFNGTIVSSGNLTVEKGAVCDTDRITAESVVIMGNVTGDIFARERVELCKGSRVKGNITSARIRIAEEVEYEGRITMLDEEPAADLFSVASEDFKKSLVIKKAVAR